MQITRNRMRLLASLVLVFFLAVILPLPAAQAALIGTETALSDNSAAHQQLTQLLLRTDVQDKLVHAGVDPSLVAQRVASLTNAEAQQLASQFEQLPEGQGVLEVLLVVFLVLLFTDIMGWTDVFPFVKKTAN